MRFTRTKAIIIAAVTALLSAGLLVAATFALFSDSVKVVNHLEAGTLDVSLYKISETSLIADEHGVIPAAPVTKDYADAPIDLEDSEASVFALGNCVPGIWQEVTLRIVNNGSVAFDYSVAIVVTSEIEGKTELLAEQLMVTVSNASGQEVVQPFSLAVAQERGAIALGSLIEANSSAEFKIKIALPANEGSLDSGAEGATIMGARIDFDLSVKAQQKVEQA
mgnify:CR=1 FL=1